MKEQKKNKGSVLVAESAYNAQNAQFGLVMFATTGLQFVLKMFKKTCCYLGENFFDSELQRFNRYYSTVLEVVFDRAWLSSRYFSTVLEVSLYRARCIFRPYSKYVLSEFDVCFEFVLNHNPCLDCLFLVKH